TLFFVPGGVDGRELWKSDGTAAGTVRLKQFNPPGGHAFPARGGKPLFAAGRLLFFVATDGDHTAALWKSDGTAEGTVLVKDIIPGPEGAFPDFREIGHQIGNLTAVGRTVFFAADDGVHGRKLWKSDGTAAGTVLVKDVSPGSDLQLLAAPEASLASVNGTL